MLYSSSSNGWCGTAWAREVWPGFLASVTAALGLQFDVIVSKQDTISNQGSVAVSKDSVLAHMYLLSVSQSAAQNAQYSLANIVGTDSLCHQLWRIYTSSLSRGLQYVIPIRSHAHQYYVPPKTLSFGIQYQPRVINPIPVAAWCRLPWLDSSWPFADTSTQTFRALTLQYSTPAIRAISQQLRVSIPGNIKFGIQELIQPGERNIAGNQYLQAVVDTRKVSANQVALKISTLSAFFHGVTVSPGFRKKFFAQYSQTTNAQQLVRHAFTASLASKKPVGYQFLIKPAASPRLFAQWFQKIDTNSADKNRLAKHQYVASIAKANSICGQIKIDVSRLIRNSHEYGMSIDSLDAKHLQYRYISPYKAIGGSWLVDSWPGGSGRYRWPYISDVYSKATYVQFSTYISTNLSRTNSVTGLQYKVTSSKIAPMKHQFWALPGENKDVQHQYSLVFFPDVFQNIEKISHQFVVQSILKLQQQWRISVYNTTNFRVLWEFASDGITYNNLMASSEFGLDFRALNLKDDLVERVWRSTGVQDEWIQVDVGEGRAAYFDTIALIEHNFSAGAHVKVYGLGTEYSTTPTEDDWNRATLYAEMAMPNGGAREESNLIWLASEQPTKAFRYWRIRISDPYNTDGYLQFGRLAAGSSLIFTRENFDMKVEYSTVNYKDSLELNGFSSIANNRALRKKMRLTFPDLNAIGDSNYAHLNSYLRYCRDTLKALVIADPQHPYRFTVFAKLTEMPRQELNYIDDSSLYATMTLEWNEGK